MKIFNPTATLNLKIVGVVVLLMITVTAYTHWMSLRDENEKNISRLTAITNFLVQKKPVNLFTEIAVGQTADYTSVQDQILALNKELQPILNDIFLPINTIKFGFFSRQCESFVAIGPQSDTSLLIGIQPNRLDTIYKTNKEQLLEIDNSIIWHGAKAIIYIKPLEEHGVIIGHAFAAINQDAITTAIWNRTVNTFLGTFIMLLVCIIIFGELFAKLKTDLRLFAESILAGESDNYSCEITEFTPILKYISEQTEQMTRLDRLNIIGEMAAGIAHEIRNPMTTVRGFLQFIGTKQEFTMQKETFSIMINELDRANSIITEFLSLAKNRAMTFSENNLNTIIHDIYPLLQADAASHNCEINLNLNNIPTVSADENSIRQLIFNMIRNGLDAMPSKGIITISTTTNASKVLLSIQDSGVGIPLEIRDKLGTPFFTTKDTGTGLGLAICYRIVQLHTATLTIESELGKGTTFIIEFNPL